MAKKYIGIDIGSTASKVCVLEEGKEPVYDVLPTGWNSKITAGIIKEDLLKKYGDIEDSDIVATGYGRISVDYADKVITEITSALTMPTRSSLRSHATAEAAMR